MDAESLPKHYDPQAAQARWLEYWDREKFWHSEPDTKRDPYTIVIPPPNVTGALHMGHALNNTLQDVLIRWRRMQGKNAEWMPGTDHAGIATQAVVLRRIKDEEGKTAREIGREEFLKRTWAWKDRYEARILNQLKQLGCSCDWDRTRFTMDDGYSRAVRTTFFNWFRDGYIFRGKRLVNWDTHLQTSVADDETYTEEIQGGFWTFKYPVVGGQLSVVSDPEYIRFSTTRPETMLGDTAVAVHPSDPRYKNLIGKKVLVPLVNREIPIIADGLLADPEKGTGAVKVTPAHDPNDYACGLRHKLPMINILNPDGTINENGGKYAGLDRYQAREAVIADMEALSLFEGREDRAIPLKFSDRSKSPIEPYLSDQWFVRMGDDIPANDERAAHEVSGSQPLTSCAAPSRKGFAQMAMDAVTSGKVKFTPERYAKSYLDWLGEKRDWCISRQLWWGHRIPVWTLQLHSGNQKGLLEDLQDYLREIGLLDDVMLRFELEDDTWIQICTGSARADRAMEALNVFFQLTGAPKLDQNEYQDVVHSQRAWDLARSIMDGPAASPIEQDPDVLDTWFSSQLWPYATFGWPEKTAELGYNYPTSTLVTSRDIITLWVARMVISGLYNMESVPFRDVYITPKLLDGFGETMSKSKGNGVDPLDIIELYGADALRYYIVSAAGETQDTRLPVSNVCPHCQTNVPVKHEHMYMRTKKINCPGCKKPFRPGGPWPEPDPELPTAKQGSERFEQGRNFANKLWNASRFLLMNLEGYTPGPVDFASLPVEDKWIVSRLATTTRAITEYLEGFRYSDVARTIYDFSWSEFCDWYVEMSKGRLKDPAQRKTAQRVLIAVLDGIIRLVHPIMPFLAEEVWHALGELAPERGLPTPRKAERSVMIAAWPEYPTAWTDADIETRLGRIQELVRAVREIRNRYNVDVKVPVDIVVRCGEAIAKDLRALEPFIQQLATVANCEFGPDVTKPPQKSSFIHPDFELSVSLVGLIDPVKEAAKLEKQIAEKRKHLEGTKKKLADPKFAERAPADVVQQQREAVVETEAQIRALEANLEELKSQ
ncbi:MAG: valine--tRNA ligase [Gemmataceae bacterium]